MTSIIRNKIVLTASFSFLLLSCSQTSQLDKDKAYKQAQYAVELMDKGKVDESINLLEESIKLDPDSFVYQYELAYAKYLKNDFKSSIEILNKIENHKESNDLLYQLLGNSYDNISNPKKAIETYEKGLKKFPNSGPLYLELGIMQLGAKKYDKALDYFEKGIQNAPNFSSNYYRASLLYLNSSEEVWGMIYGELFMNLERNSKRTAEISKLLFETYKSEIQFKSDSTMNVSFAQNMELDLKSASPKLPFANMVYEFGLVMSIVGEKSINLSSLNNIRHNFLNFYYDKNYDKEYPNSLFAFQKKVKEAGHLEAYNYWILMKGDEEEFSKWKSKNVMKWENFVIWFEKNKLELSKENQFYRLQY